MTLLQMGGAGSLMIAAIVALRVVGRERLPAGLFPWFWLAVCARLLIPFSLPFRFSAFTGIGSAVEAATPVPTPMVQRVSSFLPVSPTVQPVATPIPAASTSPWFYIWFGGGLLVAGYFAFLYIRYRRAFACSLPAKSPAVEAWTLQHPIRRNVRVRVCAGLSTPVAYGLLRPVILLPAMDIFATEEQLHCVLCHELEHIKALDEVKKLLFVACVCVHWFNPLVWLMLLLAGRDIELACDARVLRSHTAKKAYALTLLDLAAQKQHPTPLYSGFGRYAIKERVKAIMNFKKASLLAVLLSCLLLAGVFTAFATSGAGEEDSTPTSTIASLPNGLANKYAPLVPLVLEGYRDMSITDFREEINSLLDEDFPVRMQLLDEMHELEEYAATNIEVNYLLNTMLPLAAENWNPRTLNGVALRNYDDSSHSLIEYSLKYTIEAPDALTVGEYLDALSAHADDIDAYLNGLSKEDLAEENYDAINDALPGILAAIDSAHSSSLIRIETESFSYLPDDDSGGQDFSNGDFLVEDEDDADTILPATPEDYAFILSAMDGYETQTVAQQRDALWDLFNDTEGGDEIWQRVVWDSWDVNREMGMSLTPEQAAFLQISFPASFIANITENSNYWLNINDLPSLQFIEVLREQTAMIHGEERPVYCVYLDFALEFEINDEDALLASERDAALSAVVNGTIDFVNRLTEEQLAIDATDITLAEARRLAGQYSGDNLKIAITGLRTQTWDDRMDASLN